MVICPSCQRPCSDEDRHCERCGASLARELRYGSALFAGEAQAEAVRNMRRRHRRINLALCLIGFPLVQVVVAMVLSGIYDLWLLAIAGAGAALVLLVRQLRLGHLSAIGIQAVMMIPLLVLARPDPFQNRTLPFIGDLAMLVIAALVAQSVGQDVDR